MTEGEVSRSDVVDRLEESSISDVVEWLKKGIRKDPYWSDGHRLLGDLYLTELDHETYALMEYRKLRESVEEFAASDRLRLALANDRGSFPEKVARLMEEIDRRELPDELTLVRTDLNVDDLLNQLNQKTEKSVEEHGNEWFEKHRDEGMEYLEAGNPYEAQSSFEKALEYEDDPGTRAWLADALLRRRKYPRAMTLAKSVLAECPDHERARSVLEDTYDRLGLSGSTDRGDGTSVSSFQQTG